MSTNTVILAVTLGLAAGVLAGTFGVGGGILFVPTLVALDLGQVEAGATSLLAIVPTAAVGVLRQRGRGVLRPKDALVIGIASLAGIEAGIQVATRLDESLLRRLFGALLLVVAVQLTVRCLRQGRRYPGGS